MYVETHFFRFYRNYRAASKSRACSHTVPHTRTHCVQCFSSWSSNLPLFSAVHSVRILTASKSHARILPGHVMISSHGARLIWIVECLFFPLLLCCKRTSACANVHCSSKLFIKFQCRLDYSTLGWCVLFFLLCKHFFMKWAAAATTMTTLALVFPVTLLTATRGSCLSLSVSVSVSVCFWNMNTHLCNPIAHLRQRMWVLLRFLWLCVLTAVRWASDRTRMRTSVHA